MTEFNSAPESSLDFNIFAHVAQYGRLQSFRILATRTIKPNSLIVDG